MRWEYAYAFQRFIREDLERTLHELSIPGFLGSEVFRHPSPDRIGFSTIATEGGETEEEEAGEAKEEAPTHREIDMEEGRVQSEDMRRRHASGSSSHRRRSRLRMGTMESHDVEYFVVLLRFSSLDDLESWLHSEQRQRVVAQCEPVLSEMLASPADFRVFPSRSILLPADSGPARPIHDALSATFDAEPSQRGLSPPVWKTAFLSSFAAFFVVWPEYVVLNPMLAPRLNGVPVLVGLVNVAILLPLMIYVTSPALNFVLHAWLAEPRIVPHKEPWRSLDQGLPSLRWKVALALLYYIPVLSIAIVSTVRWCSQCT